jgi:hypothetical protein
VRPTGNAMVGVVWIWLAARLEPRCPAAQPRGSLRPLALATQALVAHPALTLSPPPAVANSGPAPRSSDAFSVRWVRAFVEQIRAQHEYCVAVNELVHIQLR